MTMTLTLAEKYDYYERSVQNAENEVKFMRTQFKRFFGRYPLTFREDFCGTGAMSCAWVKASPEAESWGIDLDPEPISIGKMRHYSKLNRTQKSRVQYLEQNVLHVKNVPQVDVVCAFNFSYFIFKNRKQLLTYFKSVRKSLKKQGVFFLDLFGGPESQRLVTDVKPMDDLTYYWECQHFNPLTHECTFAIHFKDAKGKKHKNVFTYNWRMWTLPELRDLLIEAGFSKAYPYWEGEDEDGGGDGNFEPTEEAENCDAWVSYIAALT